MVQELVKTTLRKTPLFEPAKRWSRQRRDAAELRRWQGRGRPPPTPEIVKERAMVACARERGIRVFVETGTFYGAMIDRVRRDFDRVISIELSEELYARNEARFRSDPGVTLIQGDSAVELGPVVEALTEPALFWLDAHFAGPDSAGAGQQVPVHTELRHILGSPYPHVVFIDDGELFGTDPTYPTIDELVRFVREIDPDVVVSVDDYVISILPK